MADNYQAMGKLIESIRKIDLAISLGAISKPNPDLSALYMKKIHALLDLEKYKEANQHESDTGESGLIYAAQKGYLEVVKFYVKVKNTDINTKNGIA